jgi:hypothetical protein
VLIISESIGDMIALEHLSKLGTDHYFFGGGGWKILKKIVCKDKKVQINCLHT